MSLFLLLNTEDILKKVITKQLMVAHDFIFIILFHTMKVSGCGQLIFSFWWIVLLNWLDFTFKSFAGKCDYIFSHVSELQL